MDSTNMWQPRQEASMQELLSSIDGMPTGLTPRKGGFGDTGLSPRTENDLGPLLSFTPTPFRQRDDFSSLLGSSFRLSRADPMTTPSKMLWNNGEQMLLENAFTPMRPDWSMTASQEAIRFPLGSDWEASPLKVPLVRGTSTPLKWDM